MYSYPEIKSFSGLYLQQNSFNLPDGAMEEANNAYIPRDDLIQKCRGFYDYYTETGSDELNNLFLFDSSLFSISTSQLSYYTDSGSEPNLIGTKNVVPTDPSASISVTETSRSVQSNGNLYFTTDEGVLKLASKTSTVLQSGAPQGLDISTTFVIGTNSTFIDAGNTVGYRVLFGYTDENDNLILGAPSGIATVTNTHVLNLSATGTAGTPSTITVTSPSHGLTTGMYILVDLPTGSTLNTDVTGSYSITVIDANTFSYSISTGPAQTGLLNYAYAMPIRLEFTVPSQISSNIQWFYQLYRSSQNPGFIRSDFQLVEQANLTSAQISSRVVFFVDDTPDNFLGEYLYTNENSREGELQANYRPPLCTDVCLFNNYTIYADCTTRHMLRLAVSKTDNLALSFLYLSITSIPYYFDVNITRSRRYYGRNGAGNQTLYATCSSSGGDLLVSYTGAGLLDSATSGMWSVYISNASGGVLTEGIYYAYYISADTWKLCTTVDNWVNGVFVPIGTITSLYFEFVNSGLAELTLQSWSRTNGIVTFSTNTYSFSYEMSVLIYGSTGGGAAIANGIYKISSFTGSTFSFTDGGIDAAPGNTATYNSFDPIFIVSTSGSSSIRVRDTAQGIVKAVNRDTDSLIYSQYVSSFNSFPGQMIFQSKGFGPPIYAFESSSLGGQDFFPVLSINDVNAVFSADQELPNGFYTSKLNEPEAVPLVNFFTVGSKSARVLRVHTLKYSIIVIKEDGVWRVTGDNPRNFAVTIIDSTVICLAPSSSKVINNQVIMLSNQGVCLITDTSAAIISRKIDDVIQPILTEPTLPDYTSAITYEIERQYLISTVLPDGETRKVYAYNIFTDGWTTTDFTFRQGIIGPNNIMYYIDFDNSIKKERKNNTKIDFCSQNHDIICNLVEPDLMSAFISSLLYSPKKGDVIVSGEVINIIIRSVEISGGNYNVFFLNSCNLLDSTAYILYESYKSTIKFAPYSGGLVGRSKQFSQMQLHFKDNSVNILSIYFSGDTFGGSLETEWRSLLYPNSWGSFPWGFSYWGQEETVNFSTTTTPAPICRTYIPRFQQRGTFIQPIIENDIGGDRLNIQSLSFCVRIYGERTTK